MQDQNILHSLQQQLLKVKQDRDTLHGAVTQLHDSLMSLVLSFVPPPSLLPPVSNEENAPAIGNKQLTTPSSITPITNWAQLSVPKTASNLATPTSPTHTTISRDDSGLASHQTSTDRMTSQKVVMTQDRHKPDLSISYINDGDTTIPDHLHPDNLTIYSLNSSLTDDDDDVTLPTTMQVLSMLHLSVINLVEKFLTSTTQASQYQNDLVNVQSQLSQNEVDLSDRLSHVERLQRELDILKQELEEHRGNEKVAQEKIASLISEVEVLQNANDKDELVNETEELLKEYKELESINNGLDSKCSEQEKIIEDKDKTISDVIQQVKVLEKKLQVSQSDCNALQNVNHNLQLKMETCQVQHRQEVELLRSENSKLVKKLDVSNNRIHELEDLPAQLLMKEKTMEELQDTIKDLSCQLRDALHQVAINEAAPTLREQLVKLQEQVSQHKAKYNDLLKIYEEGVASLTSANEEIEKGKEVQATLESRMKHHDGEVKQKNEELQKLKEEIDGDRATLNDQITLLTESVDALTEQLELSNEHVTKLCLQLEEKEVLVCQLREEHSAIHGEVQGLRDETQTHLMAYQQSVVELQKLQDEVKQLKQLVEDKEMEINTLTITKGHTNERLNHLEKEMIDKEEQHQLQVLSLQEQVKSAGLDLRESQDGLKQLKDTHEQELRELEERLQAEYAGQESLLKLQLKELSETQVNINTQVLQQIADVTPLMERDALELLKICKRNNKDQAKSVEMIKSLTDANKSLQDQFVIAQNTLKDLEKSMTLANATLLRLQKELESSTERETKCQEQISKLKAVIEEKEMNEDRNVYEEDLERLRQELSGAHLEAKQANEGLEESMARVQVLLKELADSNENTRQLEGLLKKERVKVASLKSLLDDKMLTNGEGLIYSDHLQKSPVASKKRASIDKQQHQLKSLLHKTEVKCKALVFQKRYLQSELDAYYHTNQAALMMIQDMGGVAWQPFPRRCSATNPKRRFKIYAITVIASIRLKRCYRNNNNHHK
jgi:chromosome segregation ATPase